MPLVVTAIELERLTRETLIRLIWLEAERAKDENADWLEAADKLASNIESNVPTSLRRLRRRIARRDLRDVEEDPADLAVTPAETSGDAQGRGYGSDRGRRSDDVVDSQPAREDDDLSGEDDEDPLSDSNHVKRLREMADLLNKIADGLTGSDSRMGQ